MAKQIIAFRVPVESVSRLKALVVVYGYESLSELYRLILAESLNYKLKRLPIPGKTIPQAARIDPGVYAAIRERCAPGIKDTVSVWCYLAIRRWLFLAEAEDERHQNTRFYNDWAREQGRLHRGRTHG